MILLSSTDILRVVLAGTVTTNQSPLYGAYLDVADDASTAAPGVTDDTTNNTTAVDWIGSPASGKRQVKYLSLFNADTAAITVTVSYYDGSNTRTLIKAALAVGERLEYVDSIGFRVFGADGATKTSANISDGDKGDITVTTGSWSIDNDAVTNAKLANVATNTFKGRQTASTGDPEDLTPSQARKILDPVNALTNSSGTVTVDCSLGRRFTITLAANVTTLTLSNLQGSGFATEVEIQITQDGTGSRTFALPAAFKALGGSDTAIASAASAVTILTAVTFDNGTTWRYAMQESA